MKWSAGQKALIGAPFAVVVVLFVVIVMPTAVATSPETAEAARVLRACPRAVELLGTNIEAKRTGLGCSCADSTSAKTMVRFGGSKDTGIVEFQAVGRDGEWMLLDGTLTAGGEEIDLLECAGLPRPGSSEPTHEGIHHRFDAVVTSATHAGVPKGTRCSGNLVRPRNTMIADMSVSCSFGGEDTLLYSSRGYARYDLGTGAHGDMVIAYKDNKRTRRAELRIDRTRETVRVWEMEPAWEIQMAIVKPHDVKPPSVTPEPSRSYVTFTFAGRVTRTTHPTLMPEVACTGSIIRERGAGNATGTLECGGKVVYSGTSPIVVRRGGEAGQLFVEYYDAGEPTAKFSFSDTHDIVRLESTAPWEVELTVTEQSH
jgi:hypothetical protein